MCFFHCTFIYLLLRSPGRPTAANDGQHRPTKANAGPQRRKRAQTTPGASLGPQVSFFFSFSVLLTTKAHSSQRRPTQANTGQCRPTKAHEDETGPKRRQTRCLGQRCVFSFLFFLCFINKSLQQPTKANEGQHRSMQAHSRAQGWVYSPPPTTHHHHHHHLTTSSTSSTTITRARDASRALVSSFYSPPSPSLGPETCLGPSVSFYLFYFILYFTGAETHLGPLFVLFYFYFILSTSQGLRCVSVCCFFFVVILPFTSQGPGFRVQT